MKNWLRVWWPALAWAVFISAMSTAPLSSDHTKWFFEPVIRWFAPWASHAQVDLIHHYVRKCAHFTEYFVFWALLYRSIRGARAGWRWKWALTALFIAAAYSTLDELHQIFVPGRMASPYDSMLDTFGAACGMLVLYWWSRLRRDRRRSAAPAAAAPAAFGGDR